MGHLLVLLEVLEILLLHNAFLFTSSVLIESDIRATHQRAQVLVVVVVERRVVGAILLEPTRVRHPIVARGVLLEVARELLLFLVLSFVCVEGPVLEVLC